MPSRMMQLQSDKSHRLDEIKTQFRAREGYYRLMNSPDYSQRSQRAMGFSTGTTNSNTSIASNEKTCIKISLVTLNDNSDTGLTGLRQTPTANHRVANSSGSFNVRRHRRSKGARDKKICFNVGRELFVYNYDGVRTGPDASNPIYKRSYKGSSPTCHDFNQSTATSDSISLLVGFSHGQVQLIDLNGCDDQESCKEFNSDRLIDKTRVTCVKWLPNSPSLFLVAHASGQLYLYKDDLPCGPAAPTYQLYRQSEGVIVYTCKSKTTRNPIYRWNISMQSDEGANSSSGLGSSSSSLNVTDSESYSLNEFLFSPCAKYLACVSQDGFLRVYCYDTMELIGRARSYYGGLTCVCWSPDGKYVVTGGEDDLITVWSFVERRVVARGMGHKSWVSVVAFDSFYTGYDLKDTDADNDDDDDEDDKEVDERDLAGEGDEDDDEDIRSYDEIRSARHSRAGRFARAGSELRSPTFRGNVKNLSESPVLSQGHMAADGCNAGSPASKSYRFGSVGQDTQLCLWDLNDDLLRQPITKPKVSSSIVGTTSANNLAAPLNQNHTLECSTSNHNVHGPPPEGGSQLEASEVIGGNADDGRGTMPKEGTTSSGGFFSHKGSGFTKSFTLVGKRDKRNQSQRGCLDKASNSKTTNNPNLFKSESCRLVDDPTKLLGSPLCPRMNEVPLIEPIISKKISFERLTSLIFCKGGFITSCQEGFVFSWARPSRKTLRSSPGQSNDELRVIDVGTSSAV